jgi:hypothetical protein
MNSVTVRENFYNALDRAIERGVTVRQIAEACDTSQATVKRWISRKYAPYPSVCRGIMGILEGLTP